MVENDLIFRCVSLHDVCIVDYGVYEGGEGTAGLYAANRGLTYMGVPGGVYSNRRKSSGMEYKDSFAV